MFLTTLYKRRGIGAITRQTPILATLKVNKSGIWERTYDDLQTMGWLLSKDKMPEAINIGLLVSISLN